MYSKLKVLLFAASLMMFSCTVESSAEEENLFENVGETAIEKDKIKRPGGSQG